MERHFGSPTSDRPSLFVLCCSSFVRVLSVRQDHDAVMETVAKFVVAPTKVMVQAFMGFLNVAYLFVSGTNLKNEGQALGTGASDTATKLPEGNGAWPNGRVPDGTPASTGPSMKFNRADLPDPRTQEFSTQEFPTQEFQRDTNGPATTSPYEMAGA